MRNARFRSTAATLAAALSVSLFGGCATDRERRTETLTSEEFRILYPRQYLDSLDPSERLNVERRMMEEELRRGKKR
jgi:hypothetical protein